MSSRMIFRENGRVIRTQRLWRRWLGAALWPAVSAMALLSAVLLIAMTSDPEPLPAELEAVNTVQMAAFEAGRLAEKQASAQRVAMAYKQGWRDAMAQADRQGGAAPGALRAGAGAQP